MKRMPFNQIRDLIFENYYKRIGFSKENSYHSMKCSEKKFVVVWEQIKGTMEAFNDFKNKQQKCMKQCFLICKSMYILEVFSIHYTLR